MSCIYKITNPKGKVYIGQTVNFERRLREYKRNHCKCQVKVHRSIAKYGFDKHKIEIVQYCDDSELNELERFYQELYNCVGDNGLNMKFVEANGRSGKLSQEIKDKIGNAHKGKKHSEESKRKLSLAKIGKPSWNKGVPMRQETKDKLSKSKNGNIPWNKGVKRTEREVKNISIGRTGKMIGENNYMSKIILNKETGIFYIGISDAANSYDGNYNSMRDRLNGKKKNKTSYVSV